MTPRAPSTEEQVTDPENHDYNAERPWISPPKQEYDDYEDRFDWYFD